MEQIKVEVLEYVEGGRAIWIHNSQGATVLRIQCTGKIVVDRECINICAHSDINVTGDIHLCVPSAAKKKRKPKESAKKV